MKRIARRQSRFGAIAIEEDVRTGALAYVQGGYYQSQADRDHVSLLIYVHAIFGLIAQTRARNVLMIGCAGGSLATMLARRHLRVTALDVNPHAFELAQRYFGLADNVECRIADGAAFLHATRRTFDAIVIDAFQGGVMDGNLLAPRFVAACRKRLTEDGSIFVNIHVRSDRDMAADRMAAALKASFSRVRILDRPGVRYRNAVVMAGSVAKLRRPELVMPPSVDSRRIAKTLAGMRFRRARTVQE